jgi:hypothetical protein
VKNQRALYAEKAVKIQSIMLAVNVRSVSAGPSLISLIWIRRIDAG